MFSTPRRRVWGWVLLWMSAAIVGFGILGVILSTRQLAEDVHDTQLEGTPTGKRLLESANRILDCTTPEGECYSRSQARTADAVASINRVVVLAAACSVGLDPEWSVTRRQIIIQSCVIDRLSAKP